MSSLIARGDIVARIAADARPAGHCDADPTAKSVLKRLCLAGMSSCASGAAGREVAAGHGLWGLPALVMSQDIGNSPNPSGFGLLPFLGLAQAAGRAWVGGPVCPLGCKVHRVDVKPRGSNALYISRTKLL